MRAEALLSEDTTTQYLRWEIVFEGSERRRLERLGGPLLLRLGATHYVDEAGKQHAHTVVEVPVFPHPGRRNQGQAKFTDFESRRSFLERLQQAVTVEAAAFVAEAAPGSVPLEGHAITREAPATAGA